MGWGGVGVNISFWVSEKQAKDYTRGSRTVTVWRRREKQKIKSFLFMKSCTLSIKLGSHVSAIQLKTWTQMSTLAENEVPKIVSPLESLYF